MKNSIRFGAGFFACLISGYAFAAADQGIAEKLNKLYEEEKALKEQLDLLNEFSSDVKSGKSVVINVFPGCLVPIDKASFEKYAALLVLTEKIKPEELAGRVNELIKLSKSWVEVTAEDIKSLESKLEENKKWQFYYLDQLSKTGGGVINKGWTGEWIGRDSDMARYIETWIISGERGALAIHGDFKDRENGKVVGTFSASDIKIEGDRFSFQQRIEPPPDSGWAKENAGYARLDGDNLVLTFTKYSGTTTLVRKKAPDIKR